MRILLFVIILAPALSIVNGQSNLEIRELFDDGEYFFSRGDYTEASYYFKKLLESHPDNSHFNFMQGECYMNMPGYEALAITCFEKATKHTVAKNKYRRKDFEEKNAPLHAWFYLGNVYRVANRLDDALKAYYTFINSPFYYGNYNLNIVENEIKSCERAKIILDSPVEVDEMMLDSVINTPASEIYPVVSADGQYMIFIRRLQFYDAIFCTVKQGDTWSRPVNLNPMVQSDGDFYPVCISGDGLELYLERRNQDGSDLYVSFRNEESWSKAKPLGRHINTRAMETSACLSADKNTLWFTSSRPGGEGGLDIYYSQKNKDGQWGKARNAGKVINTPFDEEKPCLTYADRVLYFCSKGHYSMGGFDIFYTTKSGKSWTDPVNIGFPVNNTADNLGFAVLQNGVTGYLSKLSTNRLAAEDIFRITLKSNKPIP